MIDFPGKTACTIFLGGCNFRCGYCHNPELVVSKGGENYLESYVFNFLEKRKGLLEGVCISGGEPTRQLGLELFIRQIKDMGFAVKLDTNGSNYATLGKLKQNGLVDYVAMDVKGPPRLYTGLIGKEFFEPRDGYEKGIAVTAQFPDYEFRTTIVPIVREDEISFMTVKEIVDTAKLIYDCTGNNHHKYYLQAFVPRKGELIDSRLEKFPETPKELLEDMLEAVREYLPNCEIR